MSLPAMVEDNLSVTFAIPDSPLMLDPMSVSLSADLRIIQRDGKHLTKNYKLFVVKKNLDSKIWKIIVTFYFLGGKYTS